jgi:hypothetical protein
MATFSPRAEASNFSVGTFRPWGGYGISSGRWVVGDLNVDGRDDLVHLVDGDYVHTWLSNGDGNFSVGTFRPWGGYGISSGRWVVGDLNADGRDDLVHLVDGDYVHTWLSNGDGNPACTPTLASMRFTAKGPSTWPAACWRPFDTPSNPFVRPIPSSAKVQQLHGNSSPIVTQLLASGRPGEFQGRLDGHAGEPTYYSQPSDPEYTIHCRNDSCGAPDRHCSALENRKVRIPSWALLEGGKAIIPGPPPDCEGGDGHMTIIDRAGGVQYDFWQVQTAPLPAPLLPGSGDPPREVIISAGNRISLNSSGLYEEGSQTPDSFGVGRNATAGYFAGQQGKVRLEELQAEEINHALFMLVRCHNNFEEGDGVVYPAAGSGGRKCTGSFASENANAPAMGAHFFYDRTPEQIDNLRRTDGTLLPAWKRTMLKALSRYGAFVGDTAGRWGFDQEAGYQYSSVPDGARRWYDYGADPKQGWQRFLGEPTDPGDRYYGRLYDLAGGPGAQASDIEDRAIIDFQTYLKVLKPCVSQGTCS